MKYLVSWETRGEMTVERAQRMMTVFGKWAPDASVTFHQFVERVDGRGGYAVVETDNAVALVRDAALFSEFLDFTYTPVVDVLDAVGAQQEALATLESIS